VAYRIQFEPRDISRESALAQEVGVGLAIAAIEAVLDRSKNLYHREIYHTQRETNSTQRETNSQRSRTRDGICGM
jgi:hypothetical protein